MPVTCDVDLIDALRAAGLGGVPDPASVRLVDLDRPAERLPAQFSPAFVERLPLDAPGTPPPTWICRFPAGPDAPVTPAVTMRGQVSLLWRPGSLRRPALEFDLFDDAWAVQVPYPPNHFQILLPDGRVPPPAFFPEAHMVPSPGGSLDFRIGRDRFLTYVYESDVRKPYFFPVYGPSGDGLTRMGHPHDPTGSHRHHRSLWIAHASVGGVDFWHDWRPDAPIIRHRRFSEREQGPVFARLLEELEWQSADGRSLLAEQRAITAYATAGDVRLLDLELTFMAVEELTLGQSPFGFLAFRVAEPMTPYDGGGVIRNAEGRFNDALCLQPSRWADFSGPVGTDRQAGITILQHRANPRHPGPFYCRNDGWLGACFNGNEELTLREGESLTVRYRLLIHDGAGSETAIETAYQGYAEPMVVAPDGPAVLVGRSLLQWE